ncbi:MAG: hypothetical protein RL362_683 [Bacteroidota bacterium]|jgi:gliding motility-associated-like protein
MNYRVLAFIVCLCGSVFVSNAQVNLVPNGSFEDYSECPKGATAIGWDQLIKCNYWYRPNYATTDYFNACCNSDPSFINVSGVPSNFLGWQQAYDGNAYIGVVNYSSTLVDCAEYVQVQLKAPLIPCEKYLVSFMLSLSDFSFYATSTMGLRLDVEAISRADVLGFELPPHVSFNGFITDTLGWVKVSSVYEADGDEEYLTVGRFLDTLLYSNFYSPHITVPCDACPIVEDVAYYYVDDISVIQISNSSESSAIPNVLSANDDYVNELWYPTHVCFNEWKCEIFNRWGQEVYTFKEHELGWNGEDINGNQLDDGVYFFRISNGESVETGYVHLIR